MFMHLFLLHVFFLEVFLLGYALMVMPFALVAYVLTYHVVRARSSLAISPGNAVIGFFLTWLLLLCINTLVFFLLERYTDDPLATVIFAYWMYVLLAPLALAVLAGCCVLVLRLLNGPLHWSLKGGGVEAPAAQCRKCGSEFPAGHRACPQCGASTLRLRLALGFTTANVAALLGAAAMMALFPTQDEAKRALAGMEAARYRALTPEQKAAEEDAAHKKQRDAWLREAREFAQHPEQPNSAVQHCWSSVATSYNRPQSDVDTGNWQQWVHDDGSIRIRVALRTGLQPPDEPMRLVDCLVLRTIEGGGGWRMISMRMVKDPAQGDFPADEQARRRFVAMMDLTSAQRAGYFAQQKKRAGAEKSVESACIAALSQKFQAPGRRNYGGSIEFEHLPDGAVDAYLSVRREETMYRDLVTMKCSAHESAGSWSVDAIEDTAPRGPAARAAQAAAARQSQ